MRHSDGLRNGFANLVLAAIDAAAGPGSFIVFDAGDVALFQIVFGDPAGTVTGGVLNFAGFPRSDLSPAASGVADYAELRDADNNFVEELTVGLATDPPPAKDVVLDSLNIVAGYPVLIQSAAYTAPP